MIAGTLKAALLSDDGPRSRLLALLLLAILVGLAFAPFLFPGTRSLNVAAKICVFILLVASYDLLLGYTGIVSFAHTMFFGIGGYGVALAMSRFGVDWGNIAVGTVGALLLSLVLSLAVGLFSLRVKTIFFAMITLAIASFFAILASQLSDITGGEDGITFKLPEVLSPGAKLMEAPIFGVDITGRLLTYYLVFAGSLAGFLVLLRIVNSPFGRVLQAIRENEFRAEAVGYRTVNFRTAASVISALAATLAGVLYALWLRYSGPGGDTLVHHHGRHPADGGHRRHGHLYGAAIGATLFVLAQTYLQDLMRAASEATAAIPLLPVLIHPDRWLLWLGVLFVLSVYFLPAGLVGKLRAGSGAQR